MESMIISGQAGTRGAACPISVRPLLRDRRERRGTGSLDAVLSVDRTFPAIDVAFLPVRALD
jgi:hypothetical protein